MMKWSMSELPFLGNQYKGLEAELVRWRDDFPTIEKNIAHLSLDAQCKVLLAELGNSGLLRYAVPELGHKVDVRAACMIREALAYDSALADFVFAMQGIGSAPIWLFGHNELQQRYLEGNRDGTRAAAFAMSEPDGSSDVASLTTQAECIGDQYVINGVKSWISNGGIADQYIVIARTESMSGSKGLSAIVVDADTPGLVIDSRTNIISPHPIATIRFTDCRVPVTNRLGNPGEGFKIAMSTLDIFRSSVGAAAVGLARRALDETIARVQVRSIFGQRMSEMDTIRMKVADMALELDMATMLVYRAAWLKDTVDRRVTKEVAMAKLGATEIAQRVVDAAVQLFGGMGVTRGSIIERLYRDVRPMRIYEGASEVQRLIIGRQILN